MLQKVVKDRFAYAYAWQDNGFCFCTQDTLLITRGGGTPIHYLYGYVPPKGVVILKLLV